MASSQVSISVGEGTGKLDASMRSHTDNKPFADCVTRAFERKRFKKGRTGFTYDSGYDL